MVGVVNRNIFYNREFEFSDEKNELWRETETLRGLTIEQKKNVSCQNMTLDFCFKDTATFRNIGTPSATILTESSMKLILFLMNFVEHLTKSRRIRFQSDFPHFYPRIGGLIGMRSFFPKMIAQVQNHGSWLSICDMRTFQQHLQSQSNFQTYRAPSLSN